MTSVFFGVFSGLYSETYREKFSFYKRSGPSRSFQDIFSVKTLIIEKDQWYVMLIFKASLNTIFVSKVKNTTDI